MRGKWISVGLLLSGIGALAITILMNRHAGESMGATAEGRALLSAGAITVDVVGICVFGLAAGALLRARTWGIKAVGAAFLVVMLGSVGFSIMSIMNFVATERMSVDNAIRERQAERARRSQNAEAAAKQRQEAALAAAEKQRQEQNRLAEQHLKWLQGVARKDDLTRKERKEIISGAGDVIAKIGQPALPQLADQAPAAPTDETVLVRSEAGPEMIAEFSGLQARAVLMVQMGWLAILLISYKALAFPGVSLTWPRETIDIKPAVSEPSAPAVSPVALTPVVAPLALPGPAVGTALPAPDQQVAQIAPPKPAEPPAETPASGLAKPTVSPQPVPNPFIDGRPLPGSEGSLASINFEFDRRPTGQLKIKEGPKDSARRFAIVCKAYGQTGGFWADEIKRLYDQFCIADHREPTSMRDVWSALQNTRGVEYAKVRVNPGTENKAARYSITPARYSKPAVKEPANDKEPAPSEVGGKTSGPFESWAVAANDTAPLKPQVAKARVALKTPAFLIEEQERWHIAQSRAWKDEMRGISRKQRGSRVNRMARAA